MRPSRHQPESRGNRGDCWIGLRLLHKEIVLGGAHNTIRRRRHGSSRSGLRVGVGGNSPREWSRPRGALTTSGDCEGFVQQRVGPLRSGMRIASAQRRHPRAVGTPPEGARSASAATGKWGRCEDSVTRALTSKGIHRTASASCSSLRRPDRSRPDCSFGTTSAIWTAGAFRCRDRPRGSPNGSCLPSLRPVAIRSFAHRPRALTQARPRIARGGTRAIARWL
jgi:hypothetical protein